MSHHLRRWPEYVQSSCWASVSECRPVVFGAASATEQSSNRNLDSCYLHFGVSCIMLRMNASVHDCSSLLKMQVTRCCEARIRTGVELLARHLLFECASKLGQSSLCLRVREPACVILCAPAQSPGLAWAGSSKSWIVLVMALQGKGIGQPQASGPQSTLHL